LNIRLLAYTQYISNLNDFRDGQIK